MQNDYIMRIIQQFVQALLAIIGHRKAGEYKEARALIQTTGRYLLRTDIDLLLFYDLDQILDHFKDLSGRLDTEKCVLSADLFRELALIEEAELQPEAALRLKKAALYLYASIIPKDPQFQKAPYFEKVAELIEELKDQPFSENVLNAVRCYENSL